MKYMIHKLLPRCAFLLQNQSHRIMFLNELAKELKLDAIINRWKIGNRPLLFHNEKISVDLKNGLLFQDGAAIRNLPDVIIQNPTCRAIFKEDNINSIWCQYKNISFGGEEGFLCHFEFQQQHFAIVQLGNQEPLIYKKCKNCGNTQPQWFQFARTGVRAEENSHLMPLVFQALQVAQKADSKSLPELHNSAPSSLPEAVLQNHMWISCTDTKFFVESKTQGLLYEGEFEGQEIKETLNNHEHVKRIVKTISAYDKGEKKSLITPWKDKTFDVFLHLAPPSKILVTNLPKILNKLTSNTLIINLNMSGKIVMITHPSRINGYAKTILGILCHLKKLNRYCL